jgi:hypothetical protein
MGEQAFGRSNVRSTVEQAFGNVRSFHIVERRSGAAAHNGAACRVPKLRGGAPGGARRRSSND